MRSIKVLTNSIMTELENEHEQLNDQSSTLYSYLDNWNVAYGSSLLIAMIDGTVVYDSNVDRIGIDGSDLDDGKMNDSHIDHSGINARNTDDIRGIARDVNVETASATTVATINPRYELDFVLRQSQESTNVYYHIAFPIFDAVSEIMIGYAQFTLPHSSVDASISSYSIMKAIGWSFLIAGLLLLLYCVISIRRYVSSQYIKPINELGAYSEAILKGDYEQRAEWIVSNEVGDLYAVFDQMRDEIRTLQLQQASHNQAHKELISNLSHDLKTPLTTIRAYVDSIREGVCPDLPSAIAYLNVVHNNIHKMTVLVDDLLLHSLRDLEQIAVHPTEQYSSDVLKPMIEHIAHYIRTTGIACEPPSSYPNVLLAIDSIRIEQVIANLVANALKHTSTGDKITLQIEEAPEQHTLKLIITDTGSGISPQDMPFVFERYYQGQAATSSAQQLQPRHGVGLGLSICKHIVEAHGGVISFHSRLDEGTTFSITLPLS